MWVVTDIGTKGTAEYKGDYYATYGRAGKNGKSKYSLMWRVDDTTMQDLAWERWDAVSLKVEPSIEDRGSEEVKIKKEDEEVKDKVEDTMVKKELEKEVKIKKEEDDSS